MRPHPRRARTDPRDPRAWASSDRNGMVGNHKDMVWQYDWAGTELINKRILIHRDEYDIPQRQLGTIVLPPDPIPIPNARPEQYLIDEVPVSTRYTMNGKIRVTLGTGTPYQPERIVSGDAFQF